MSVSYTQLDVYKRQDYNCYFKNENIIEAGYYNENGKICKAYDGTF